MLMQREENISNWRWRTPVFWFT